MVTGSELISLLLENEEIKKHKPKFNRRRKADAFTHAIDWFTDKQGIINFQIVEYEQAKNALMSFTTYFAARDKLETWIDEHVLCLRYCGLTDADSVCFNHQIKKCNGICCGQEEIEYYNKRVQKVLSAYVYEQPNFALIDKGRTMEERSLILIKDGCFKGYGYFDEFTSISGIEDVEELITSKEYIPDADDLVKSCMKQKKFAKCIKF